MTNARNESQLKVFSDPPQLFAQAARDVAEVLQTAQQTGRPAYIALAGGNTPRELYRQLCRLPAQYAPNWAQVHFFFGDERAVAATHPDSNYRMARENLFAPLNIDPSQIHRVHTEYPELEAVEDYRQQLQILPRRDGWPCFDLVLLGMGSDGHVASLFPDSSLLAEHRQTFTSGKVTHLASTRYSLSLPVLNHARRVMLLVTGQDKAETVQRALANAAATAPLPVQQLHPAHLSWYLDSAAASQLTDGVVHE